MTIRAYWPYLTAFVVFAVLMVAVFAPVTSTWPFPYDGADYMYAGTRGFVANYIDAGSLPIWTFIQKGLELRAHPEKRAEISKQARSGEDINTYRHFHGPMYAYWIALWTKLGVREEVTYRNVGLIIHVASSLAMMFAFWTLFPQWPKMAGLITGLMFLYNRTAMITAVEITQHVVFLFAAIITLWMMGLFCRNLEVRWWYATMASLAVAFASVESASLLAITMAVILLVLYRPIRERWPDWRVRVGLLLKGIGLFVLVLFAIWPAGIYKLSVVRGFMFLAYMALERKTFSPQGPFKLWEMKFAGAPWEHGLMFAGFLAALFLWKRLEHRREAMPWLIYAFVFIGVTLKVTLEFVHYRGTIAAAWTMATGIALGYLWKHWGTAGRVALALIVALCLTGETVRRYGEIHQVLAEEPPSVGILNWVQNASIPANKTLYVPFYFVPIIHYYHPNLLTAGYDSDWPAESLAQAMRSPDAHSEFLCAERACGAIAAALGGTERPARMVAPSYLGRPVYAMRANE